MNEAWQAVLFDADWLALVACGYIRMGACVRQCLWARGFVRPMDRPCSWWVVG